MSKLECRPEWHMCSLNYRRASLCISQNVVKTLAKHGAQVVGFDLIPESSLTIAGAGATFVMGNMTNLEEVMAAIVERIQRIVALGYFMAPLLAPECRDLLNAARVNIVGV